jgi:hypothetical protein
MTGDAVDHAIDSWRTQQARLQLAVLVVAFAAAALVVIWLAAQNEGTRSAIPGVNAGPKLVSQAQLEAFAKTLDRPLYWAGPKDGYSLELTQAGGSRIFIRYLPNGAEAGDPRAAFLTVGTYAGPRSFAYLKQAKAREGAGSTRLGHHGFVVFNRRKPTSVYFGYPDADYQVEVFAPSEETARTLVLTGRITPVDADAGSA